MPPFLLELFLCAFFTSITLRAVALPIGTPNLTQCQAAASNCCLLAATPIADFAFPPPSAPLRIRRPAHNLTADYIAKYENATRLMKKLPPNHPWNFYQQSHIHCAYCSAAYPQPDFPNATIGIHGSWLFFPFHRGYLYFYERILGNLIGDPTFALPFWNWDSPAGMTFPAPYTAKNSSLYNPRRDKSHQPPTLVEFQELDLNASDADIKARNLRVMNRQMVSGGRTAELFLGSPYRAGDGEFPGSGSLESFPHGLVHVWTGGDMSSVAVAGSDPVFFAHHANVDRLWDVWRRLPGIKGPKGFFNDSDWLDAAFLFYDENQKLVRMKVRDCLEVGKLRYTYERVPIEWLHMRPKAEEEFAVEVGVSEFPMEVSEKVSVNVVRKREGEGEEVLVVDGIEVGRSVYVRFDVYVGKVGSAAAMRAGSFVHVPAGRRREGVVRKRRRMEVRDVLEEVGASGDGSVVVSLVPGSGSGKVVVGDIRIEFSK